MSILFEPLKPLFIPWILLCGECWCNGNFRVVANVKFQDCLYLFIFLEYFSFPFFFFSVSIQLFLSNSNLFNLSINLILKLLSLKFLHWHPIDFILSSCLYSDFNPTWLNCAVCQNSYQPFSHLVSRLRWQSSSELHQYFMHLGFISLGTFEFSPNL